MSSNTTKGDYNQECNRTACSNQGAKFYNHSTRMYYCRSCAEQINYWSKLDHNTILCIEEKDKKDEYNTSKKN